MERKKGSKRGGRFVFFAPVLAVIGLVVVGIVVYASDQTGTIVVEAVTADRYSPQLTLHAPFAVGSSTRTTPYNFTLPVGQHIVIYGAVEWFRTPAPRTISVEGGRTVFAIATYVPLVKAVSISQAGFNATGVTALHSVTPVAWINNTGASVILEIGQVGSFPIAPAQNYTHVFTSKGTFSFDIVHEAFNGQVIAS